MINAARRGISRPGGAVIRLAIRVRPGSARTRVGGAYGAALVVHVTARPVDGAATAAALTALAAAFGVPAGAVRLVTGATSRDKLVEVDGDPAALSAIADRLRAG